MKLALQADATPSRDWSLSVRLLRDGTEAAQQDHVAPAAGFAPTTSLSPGDVVVDAFRFQLDPAFEPDRVRVILYRSLPSGQFENLTDVTLP